MKLKAIIFDFDGVLVNSHKTHVEAWSLSQNDVFGEEMAAETKQQLKGLATTTISSLICKKYNSLSKVQELIKLKNKYVSDIATQIPFFDNIIPTMQNLILNNVIIGIASNAPRAMVKNSIANTILNNKIKVILGREDVERVKPYPDIYLKCAQMLGLDFKQHKDIAIFEDSTHGLKAAIDAKMFAIGVTSQQSAATLFQAGAKYICSSVDKAVTEGIFNKNNEKTMLSFES